MAKPQSSFLNMLLALSLVALISSVALSGAYLLTKDAIAASQLRQKLAVLEAVLPSFDNDPNAEKYSVVTRQGPMVFYPARKNGQLVAAAVETFSLKGYSGRIEVLAAFLPDGSIYDAVVTSHQETPGLGSKLSPAQSSFAAQFKGKNPRNFRLNVRKDGGDVDAITAATVSSRAYCDALRAAYEAFEQNF